MGRLANGLTIYRFRYLNSDTMYVGVMAQEVLRVVPDAVGMSPDGYLWVNYARIGFRMWRYDEWVARTPFIGRFRASDCLAA